MYSEPKNPAKGNRWLKDDFITKDRLILYHLRENSRQSFSELARKTGLSKEVVRYRVMGLVNKGVISNFGIAADSSKMGYSDYKIYIQTRSMNKEVEKKFIEFLLKDSNVTWISTIDGRYDIVFAITAKNLSEFNFILKKIVDKYDKIFRDKEINIPIYGITFPLDFLINKERSVIMDTAKYFESSSEELEKTDEKDITILSELDKDSRINTSILAKKAGLSIDTTKVRIKNLFKKKILKQYNIEVDLSKFKPQYKRIKVLIKLKHMSNEEEKKMIQFAYSVPNIYSFIYSVGRWDLEITMFVENTEDYKEIMNKMIDRFGNVIESYEPLFIRKIYRHRDVVRSS
jgi:DNA-binding Lrp family transcriptional regulator